MGINFFFSKRRALPSGRPSCKTNSPGAPLGRDIVSRAVGHPATAKPQLKSREVVHPQAIYRELCYKQTQQGRSCSLSPKAGKLDAPSEAALVSAASSAGVVHNQRTSSPKGPRVLQIWSKHAWGDPWKLAESSPHHGAIFGNYSPKARPFRLPWEGSQLLASIKGTSSLAACGSGLKCQHPWHLPHRHTNATRWPTWPEGRSAHGALARGTENNAGPHRHTFGFYSNPHGATGENRSKKPGKAPCHVNLWTI